MILLLEPHLLLWAAAGSPRLSSKAAELILDENNRLLFSAASIWDVAIKSRPNRPDFKVSASRFGAAGSTTATDPALGIRACLTDVV